MTWVEYVYLEPIMALRLQDYYKVPLWVNNLCFAILPSSFIIGSIALTMLTSVFKVNPNSHSQIVTAGTFATLSLLMCGPSNLLPDRLFIIIIGLFGLGFSVFFQLVPILPLIQSEIVRQFGSEQAMQMTDSTSALYTIFGQSGNLIGPLISQESQNMLGYRATSDVIFTLSLIVLILFGILG